MWCFDENFVTNLGHYDVMMMIEKIQLNIWKVVHLKCGEWCEDMIDYSSCTRNLSSCEFKSWKEKIRSERDSNPWPSWYRCSALPTELWSCRSLFNLSCLNMCKVFLCPVQCSDYDEPPMLEKIYGDGSHIHKTTCGLQLKLVYMVYEWMKISKAIVFPQANQWDPMCH